MEDNRHYDRYSIKCNGNISDDHQNYQFITNNISAGGMNITTDREIEDGTPLTIQIDIPQALPRSKQLQGVIVRKEEDNDGYNYGIRFYGMTHMEIVDIDECLRESHFTSLENKV